jgi:steroid 5-alpha reductase family enzyme
MLTTILTVFILVAIYMSVWFVISLLVNRNDIADMAWGLGFIVIALSLLIQRGFALDHLGIITLLISIWGLRLAYHIFRRLVSKPEDRRYLAWREQWGKWFFIGSYLQVFLLQGLFMVMISMSTIVASQYLAVSLSWLSYLGVAVWMVGFYFESRGDYELKQFVSDPANHGKLMQTGLWAYTRHPNYFGEVTQWWGIFLIVASLPLGLWALISPLTITLLILFVSGIPMLEAKYVGRPDWEEYKRRVSVFVPWFPKS